MDGPAKSCNSWCCIPYFIGFQPSVWCRISQPQYDFCSFHKCWYPNHGWFMENPSINGWFRAIHGYTTIPPTSKPPTPASAPSRRLPRRPVAAPGPGGSGRWCRRRRGRRCSCGARRNPGGWPRNRRNGGVYSDKWRIWSWFTIWLWLTVCELERSTMLLSSVNHLFLSAIYTMANC